MTPPSTTTPKARYNTKQKAQGESGDPSFPLPVTEDGVPVTQNGIPVTESP